MLTHLQINNNWSHFCALSSLPLCIRQFLHRFTSMWTIKQIQYSLTFIQFTQQTNNSYAFQIGHSTISIQWNGLTQYQIEEGRNKPWFMMETLFCSRWDMHCFRQSIAFQCFGINTTLDEIQNSMLYIHVCDKGKLYYLTVSCISRVVSWSVIFVMNWRYVILPRL